MPWWKELYRQIQLMDTATLMFKILDMPSLTFPKFVSTAKQTLILGRFILHPQMALSSKLLLRAFKPETLLQHGQEPRLRSLVKMPFCPVQQIQPFPNLQVVCTIFRFIKAETTIGKTKTICVQKQNPRNYRALTGVSVFSC